MLDTLKDQLNALPHDKVRRIVMPIATALQEAQDLLELCRIPTVTVALEEVGMKPGFDRELEVRIQAAREAQSAWIAARERIKPKELLELETEAVSLRRRMLAASRFNLRDVREAQVALATIRGGNGVDDLVQDLFDLASVCVKYAPAFDADRSFDVDEHIDKARTLGRRLSHVVSSVRLGTDATAARELRDRAFSYMQELVNEIRFAGRYAFRDDPISVARFSSRHLKKQRRASKKAAASAASSTSAPADEAAIAGPFEETVELPADEGDGMN